MRKKLTFGFEIQLVLVQKSRFRARCRSADFALTARVPVLLMAGSCSRVRKHVYEVSRVEAGGATALLRARDG